MLDRFRPRLHSVLDVERIPKRSIKLDALLKVELAHWICV
jgi:hypothetical protein